MDRGLLLIVLMWLIWCFFHSVLISRTVAGWVEAQAWHRYFRLFYVIFSVLTVLPVFIFTLTIEQRVLFQWAGWWRMLQISLGAYALYFFIGGARAYDAKEFLGLSFKEKDDQAAPSTLRTSGILEIVRHPWYSGGLAFLWCLGPFTNVNLAARIVLFLYLLIGSMLEERKLLRIYPERYRRYQNEVPMLLPWKKLVGLGNRWLKIGK